MVGRAAYLDVIKWYAQLCGSPTVRGMSGEGGREALPALVEALRRGESVWLAVDGPAGPLYVPKPGCIELARSAGVPVIPVIVRSERASIWTWRWDRTLVPKLFDRIAVTYGAPTDCSDGDTAALRARVQEAFARIG